MPWRRMGIKCRSGYGRSDLALPHLIEQITRHPLRQVNLANPFAFGTFTIPQVPYNYKVKTPVHLSIPCLIARRVG
jgi:hypothetical protein